MPRSDFRNDHPWGQDCERVFHEMYGGRVRRTDGRKGDFVLIPGGERLELKSEAYSTSYPFADRNKLFRRVMGIQPPPDDRGWDRSPNIAVEVWSSEFEKRGGPWQAREHGVPYYAHFFVADGKVFVYRTDLLVAYMEKIVLRRIETDPGRWLITRDNKDGLYKRFRKQNAGYVTTGYAVPRREAAKVHCGKVRMLVPDLLGEPDIPWP